MEEQDVRMGSASTPASPTTNVLTEQQLGPSSNNPGDAAPHSPGVESPTSSGAASSDDEDDEDEGGEEQEMVDENGAIVIEDDDEDDEDDTPDDEQEPQTTIKQEPSPAPNSVVAAVPPALNKPPSSKLADKADSPLPPPASTATKPKSKAKVKARSPSPLPIAAPPLQTVRLTIKLGGPDNYAVDINSLAKATGQRPPTPVQKRLDETTSDSEAERKAKEIEARTDADKPKKKVKKNAATEYYDVSDPFIDDSELAVDERKFFAQTKQQGFYVSSGEVALMKDRSSPVKKPKSKRFANNEAGPSSSQHPKSTSLAEGTKDAPIALVDDDDDGTGAHSSLAHSNTDNGHSKPNTGGGKKKNWLNKSHPGATSAPNSRSPSAQYGTGLKAPLTGNLAVMRKLNWIDPDPDPGDTGDGENEDYGDGGEKTGMKRKRVTYTTVVENGKKRKIVDIASFHPTLKASLEKLQNAIAAENWDQKGKFPPAIKPILAQVALQAVSLDEYDEHFFNLMPTLFPYNKFTMSKLIKRTIFTDHTKLLVQRQDALLTELKRQAEEGFPKAEEEWEKSVVTWDQRQKRLKVDAGHDSGSAGGPTRHPSEDLEAAHIDGLDEENHPSLMGGTAPHSEKAGKLPGDKEAQPPAKKFRLTENMKAIVWELVLLSNECCRLENEKNALEGSVMQISEQGLRKVLYQKIVASFPPGWMSSGQISRDVSSLKKKLEKEMAEDQEPDGSVAAV